MLKIGYHKKVTRFFGHSEERHLKSLKAKFRTVLNVRIYPECER